MVELKLTHPLRRQCVIISIFGLSPDLLHLAIDDLLARIVNVVVCLLSAQIVDLTLPAPIAIHLDDSRVAGATILVIHKSFDILSQRIH